VVPAYILTGVLFLAGLMSKENAVSLPAVLAMAELILFRQTYRELVGRIGLIALICVPALVMYTTINGLLTGTETLASHRGFISRLSFFWEISQRGFFEVLLTQCRILFSYLGMIFVPVPEGLPLVYAETVSRSLWDPRSTLAACVGVIGLLGAALGLVRKRPVLSFGILFFVITLVPEAFTVPQFLFFSYRAILPMAGIALILCDICSSLLNWAPNRVARAVVAVCLVALSVYLGSVTLAKAQRWNPLQIWKDDYARLPRLSENVEKRSYVTVLTHYGLALADSGDIATANELFLRAKEIAPLFDFAHLSIGYIRLKQGNLPEATEHFLKVTKLKPKLAEPHYWLGVIKDQQGKLPEAEEHFRKTVELMPRHARAHFALAELTWRQGHVSETITHYQRAIESKPDFFKAYMNLGAVMLRLGRAHEARELFEVSVALRPDRAQAHANLGIASLEVGLIDAAKTHLARALELDPTLALARNYLGAAFERTGETDQAIKLYKGALESDPRLVEAWYNLANLMAKTDNLAVAVKHYQRVLELDPRHHMAHARLGWVFLRTSELDRAVNHLRKALEIQPDLLETRKDLEQAMERLKTVNSPTPLSDY
jgi:tetratricopeptide (TPR) repeat protein